MKRTLYVFICATMMATSFSTLTSCRDDKKSAGDKMEDAIDDTGDAIEEGAEDVKDAVDDATDDNN